MIWGMSAKTLRVTDRGLDIDGHVNDMKVERFTGNPIIHPGMGGGVGDNINGPSLIRVPDWVSDPLGRYYLYFAHHRGSFIRLAYADYLEGPWRIHEPGVLSVADSYCLDHVASPDVHPDADQRMVRMYYHGVSEAGPQVSRVALSPDGVTFRARDEVLGNSYFRVFRWDSWHYALGMPGVFYRSRDGLSGFEVGPTLFTPDMRHSAVWVQRDMLHVFYSDVGDSPERILHATIDLTADWTDWEVSPPATVLEPELEYEGADLPLEPSVRGLATRRVRQLRDPAIFEEDGDLYLLYSVAGESGIAAARLWL